MCLNRSARCSKFVQLAIEMAYHGKKIRTTFVSLSTFFMAQCFSPFNAVFQKPLLLPVFFDVTTFCLILHMKLTILQRQRVFVFVNFRDTKARYLNTNRVIALAEKFWENAGSNGPVNIITAWTYAYEKRKKQ